MHIMSDIASKVSPLVAYHDIDRHVDLDNLKHSGLSFIIFFGRTSRQNVPLMTQTGRPTSSRTQLLQMFYYLCTVLETLSGFMITTFYFCPRFSVRWYQMLISDSSRIHHFLVLKYSGVYQVSVVSSLRLNTSSLVIERKEILDGMLGANLVCFQVS